MNRVYLFFMHINAWFQIHTKSRRWLMGICIWGLSATLLFPTLGSPRALVFDEVLNVPRAQRYLNHVFYQENHPPLARLFIAFGQFLLHPTDPSNEFVGDRIATSRPWPKNVDVTGYRIFPALFGSFLSILVFLIILQITKNDWMALFIGLTTALDNALVTQSHFALPESTLLFFGLLSIGCFTWLQTQEKSEGWKITFFWILYGASVCAAFLVKLTGLFVITTVPFYLLKLYTDGQLRSIIRFLLTFGLSFLTVFLVTWQVHFSLFTKFDPGIKYEISEAQRQIVEGQSHPDPFNRFWIQINDAYNFIFHFHESVGAFDPNKPDELGSPWYMWPIGGRAIPFIGALSENSVQMVYLLGNPAVWILSLIGVIGGIGILIAQLILKSFRRKYFQWYIPLLSLYLAYMLPMTQITRVMYLYHYFSPLLIGLLLFALIFLEIPGLENRTRFEVLALASIWIVVSFIVYSPFIYNIPLTYSQFATLNVWSPWDLRLP